MTTSTGPGTLLTPKQVADRRAQAAHISPPVSMFARMLLRAAVLRRRRAASALLAMIVAAAVATAMMNLYVDVQAKLRSEFRNYGANVVIVGKDGRSLPADALNKVESVLGAKTKTLAVPFAYAVARTRDGQSVVVVGTDFSRARQLNHWWKVSHWPDAPNQALIGMRAATVVSPNRQPFELSFQGKGIELTPAGMLQTGAGEDSRIYLDQSEFQNWTGVAPSTIEVAVNGTAAEVETSIRSSRNFCPPPTFAPSARSWKRRAKVRELADRRFNFRGGSINRDFDGGRRDAGPILEFRLIEINTAVFAGAGLEHPRGCELIALPWKLSSKGWRLGLATVAARIPISASFCASGQWLTFHQ